MSNIPDPLTAAVENLRFVIPTKVLQIVFLKRLNRYQSNAYSLNERIMMDVIRPRVLQDCSISYGTQAIIPLDAATITHTDAYSTVYSIPKELTQGRSIMSALNVGFGLAGYSAYGGGYQYMPNDLMNAANAMSNAHASMPITTTSNVQLIADNTILVRDTLRIQGGLYLRCVLENDERLTHLHHKAIPVLKELIKFAVQAYIYNAYLIEMAEAELIGGQELGVFKSIVEGYSDAEELYQTTLREKYSIAAFTSDQESMRRYIKTMVGGLR